jgi:hypothetical protein
MVFIYIPQKYNMQCKQNLQFLDNMLPSTFQDFILSGTNIFPKSHVQWICPTIFIKDYKYRSMGVGFKLIYLII